MKRFILITTALFASFMFLEAQEINRGLQHHVDARYEATIETFIFYNARKAYESKNLNQE